MAGHRKQTSDGGGMPLLWLGVAGVVVLGAGIAVGLWMLRSSAKDGTDKTSQGSVNFGPSSGKKPAVPVVDERFEKEIKPAVKRGVAFLRERMLAPKVEPGVPDTRLGNQVLPGVAALVGLTLLEAGVEPGDEAVKRAAEIIRSHHKDMNKVYTLSTSLFFLNKWNEMEKLSASDRRLAQSLAARIIYGQLTSGVWSYGVFALDAAQEESFLKKLADPAQPYKPKAGGPYSISNTQFAMLALWGARHHDVKVKASLLAAAEFFNTHQTADGHWIYSDVEAGTPEQPTLWTTSTAAGLISLAIEKALLEDKEFADEPPLMLDPKRKRADRDKAFKYVARSIGRTAGSPGGSTHGYRGTIFHADAWGDLYFLWCVERVGVLYGRDRFDEKGKDWYDWGYPIVLKKQSKKDGSWDDRHGDVVDTCFALLFLLRANIAQDLTDKLQLLSLLAPGRERTRTLG